MVLRSPSAINSKEGRNRAWFAAGFAIILIAAFVRIYDLDLKPLHSDEGVNGYFLMRLLDTGLYQYDPENYHGPTLYYFALAISYVFGVTATAIRLVPALFGVGTVLLVLFLRPRIGAVGALVAALLVSVSPGAVYMSRYFIHESLFVFTGLATIVAALRYCDSGAPVYLMLAFVAFGLMCATKETFIISTGVLAVAIALTPLYIGVRNRLKMSLGESRRATIERLGGRSRVALSLVGGFGLFVIVIALFFSGLFSNPKWSGDIFKALQIWTRTGRTDHVQEYYTYVWWLMQEEMPILALGLIGAGLALWRAVGRFPIFASFWATGMLAAYSLIPYKTPWLTLNLIIPLAILSGWAVNVFSGRASRSTDRVALLVCVVIGVITSVCQMAVLNYIRYDDDRYPYVYAHTHRDFNRLMDDIAQITERAGLAFNGPIAVTSEEYWPLPWYLRDYKQVSYYSEVMANGEPIVVCSESQEPEIQAMLGESYQRVGCYTLRPGFKLALYTLRFELIST